MKILGDGEISETKWGDHDHGSAIYSEDEYASATDTAAWYSSLFRVLGV